MTDGYRALVGEILPEDDLRPAYQGAFDADEKARLDAFMNSVLDENASDTQTVERPTQVIPSQETDDVETPWYAQRTDDNLAEIEGEGLADLASGVAAVGKDIWRGSTEAVPQIFGGFIDALDEAAAALQSIIPTPGVQFFDDEGNLSPSFISASDMTDSFKAGETLFDMIAPKDADSVTGGFIRAGSQFLTGMIPAFRAARAMGAGRLAASYAGGAVADALVFDPHEARLSTFLNEVPILKEIVPDYLAETGEENQTEWEGRLKNAIEGAGLGGLTDGLLKAFKVYRAQRRLAPQAEAEGGVAAIARDAELEAAEREIGSVITDDDLRPLGDPSDNAPLVIEARPGETLSASLSRLREADERAARMVDQGDALGKVQQIIEGKKRPALPSSKRFIIDETGETVRLADDQSRAPEGMRHVIGEDGRIRPVGENLLIEQPTQPGARREAIDDALDELRSGAVTKAKFPARPVASIVRDIGGIDPTSSLAGDLRSRGITSRTFPGLFRKGGVGSLDNIPGTEHQLFLEQGRVNADGYIDQQAFVDGLEAELKGEPWRTAEQRTQIDEIVAPAQELEEQMSRLGIDYENMSNDAVKARLKEIADEQEAWANYQERMFSRVDEMGGEVRSYINLVDEQRDVWTYEQIAEARAAGVDEAIIRAYEPNKVHINMARIKSAEDVKAVIQAVADADAAAIKDKTRGVVSNQKTITESSKEYQDLTDLIGRPPGPMSAAQAVAARKVLASSAEQVTQLAKIASSPNAGKVDLYNFRRSLSVHAAIQAEVIGARTETARALQSWAIPVGADRVRTEALNELINTNMGGDLSKLAKQVANLNDESALADIARQSIALKASDALYSVYVNGLLSGPKTHLVNAMSNAAVAVYSIPERFVAEGFSNAFGNGDVVRGEAAAMAYGMVEGIRDGVRLMVLGPKAEGLADLGTLWEQFGKTEMHIQPISGAAFNLDPNTLMYKGLDLMGKIVSVPGGALERADLFFKSVNYRMELHALAFREASLSGAEGKEFAEKMADIMRNPPTHLHEQANKMALVNTFTNQLGPLGQSGQRFISNTPVRWAIPFVRAPTQIMKYGFDRTPLALASSSVRADLAAGGARAAQAQARIALGTILMLTFGGLAVDGHISGGGPLDPKQRQAWELEGWQPYSVKIGDTWFAYDRLDPLGMMIGVSADLVDLTGNPQGDTSDEMVFLAAITAVTQNLASKTYMSGAFELAAALDPRNPAGSPEKFLNRQATGLIPFSAALRQTAQGMDPIVRESRDEVTGPAGEPDALGSWLNKIINDAKRQIPGMSDTLPPVRDLFGEPLSRASGVGRAWDVLVPIEASKVNNDPIARAIIENELKPSRISRQVDRINLNAEEYDELQVIAGELVRQQLEPIIKSPGFPRMSKGPDGMQGRIITRTIQNAHDTARSMFRARNPEFREKSFNKLRQGQNKLLGN